VKTVGEDYFDLLATAIEQALETGRLRAQRDDAEARLRASNGRLEALLKEVNHRVANSLQLVSAFVHMQSKGLDEGAARDALGSVQRRIQAIAQVHKRLYTSDTVETVDMHDYLTSLVAELAETWSTPASPRLLKVHVGPLRLATDKAVAVGVIVNELVSNACKYAYGENCSGEVRIALDAEGADGFRLVVEDDGCGLPSAGTVKGTGLGSKLIGAMASTLQTTVDYEVGQVGVKAVLRGSC
jgi:two-component sensor histidine kinase